MKTSPQLCLRWDQEWNLILDHYHTEIESRTKRGPEPKLFLCTWGIAEGIGNSKLQLRDNNVLVGIRSATIYLGDPYLTEMVSRTRRGHEPKMFPCTWGIGENLSNSE
ncbi:hypothetical protein TNCT_369951 [Trichonephila clavata]|uniref:Uncharacterized protein n=1 Tax=Trichonephila clavata TaxID=2740835 RepID=A0A8X6KES8_TRICU|nr:hypothetical protein TNCT_369951 [Trichonephila clavata]